MVNNIMSILSHNNLLNYCALYYRYSPPAPGLYIQYCNVTRILVDPRRKTENDAFFGKASLTCALFNWYIFQLFFHSFITEEACTRVTNHKIFIICLNYAAKIIYMWSCCNMRAYAVDVISELERKII